MKKNTSWFSIIIALGLSLLFVLTGLYLIEYMVPFSRSTKGIENASKASYEWLSWVEQSLYAISQNLPWYSENKTLSMWINKDFSYTITGSWILIPEIGKWNGLDTNWNKLSQTEPIQLSVWNNTLTSINLSLRVPRFDGNDKSLWSGSWALILWQLSSLTDSVVATASWATMGAIQYSDIPINSWIGTINLFWKNGNNINDFSVQNTLWNFYSSLGCGTQNCVLRISLINKLPQPSWTLEYPFLEYKIQTSNPIPYQITDVSTTGISNGFSKKYNIRVPQATTSAAFDFTVFQ